jgi:TPR repeat protein
MVQGTSEILRQLQREQNFSEMVRWYEVAAEQGMPEARSALARMYLVGQGMPRDLARARSMFEAINNTPTKDDYHLGLMLELGLGGPADLPRAIALYRRAAEDAIQEAEYRLGLLYEEGRGVGKDDRKAREYYESVIDHETAEGGPEADVTHEARYRLGRMAEAGRAGPIDRKRALDYYGASRSANAVRRRGEILEQGLTGKADEKAATKLYSEHLFLEDHWHGPDLDFLKRGIRRECLPEGLATVMAILDQVKDTDPHAMILAGRLLEKGVGIPKAPMLARRLYERAAKQSEAEGFYRLASQEQAGVIGKQNARMAAKYFRAAAFAAKTRYEVSTFGGGESPTYLEALRWLYKVRDDVTSPSDGRGRFSQVFIADEPDLWRLLIENIEKGEDQADDVFAIWLSRKGTVRSLTPATIAELQTRATAGSLPAAIILTVRYAMDNDQAAFDRTIPRVLAAAHEGSSLAQAMVGNLLLSKDTPYHDPVKGHAYLNLAAARGNLQARALLDAVASTLSQSDREAAETMALGMWQKHTRILQ